MSGPIVRKYGFPNFDKIFGERELQHGVDETAPPDAAPAPAAGEPAVKPKKAAKAAPKSKKK